jgi:hypothetical protein
MSLAMGSCHNHRGDKSRTRRGFDSRVKPGDGSRSIPSGRAPTDAAFAPADAAKAEGRFLCPRSSVPPLCAEGVARCPTTPQS